MLNIDLNTQFTKEILLNTFNTSVQFVSKWKERAIQWIINLPEQNNPHMTLAIFATANLFFFIMINAIANGLDERVNSTPQKLDASEKKFNRLLIDGVFVGISFLSFNVILSRLTRYSLRYSLLAIITITAIVSRTFFHSATID